MKRALWLVWLVLGLGSVVLAFTVLAPLADTAAVEVKRAHAKAGKDDKAKEAPKQTKAPKLEDISCFVCHDIATFKDPRKDGDDDDDDDEVIGKPFPHDLHKEEGAGHCHVCHAFQGHFHTVIREDTCEECH